MSLLTQELQRVFQAPTFSHPKTTYLGSEDILQSVTPLFRSYLAETKYDRMVIADQFLRHFFNQKNESPLAALTTFEIDCTLNHHPGNTCVGLSLDFIERLPKPIYAYPIGAILSQKYHQFAGPTYSHVTCLIRYQNPRDEMDSGYILLEQSFHISSPILLVNQGSAFGYDMGSKNGIWNFSIQGDEIICQGTPRPGELPWSTEELERSLMRYRTDKIENPIPSSAMPMFPIDRSLPIVSHHEDGVQPARIDIDFNKHEISWKIYDEKMPAIAFEKMPKAPFGSDIADLLRMDKEHLNEMVSRLVTHEAILDRLYEEYLQLLKTAPHFAKLLKFPEDIQKIT
jgi:hypothetical protein